MVKPPHPFERRELDIVKATPRPAVANHLDLEHEAGVLALVRAFEHILTPWLDGGAVLDYETLNEITTTEA